MGKNKKHKGQHKTVKDNSINEHSQISNKVFDGGVFDVVSKSSGANVSVSGTDLLNIVVAQYSKLSQTVTAKIPTAETKTEFCETMTKKHYTVMPNGYMAFDVVFLASLHNTKIDTSNYNKGCGLQSYITAIGTITNIKGKSSGLCAKLLKNGVSVVENQYSTNNTKHFLGRMWVIRKPQPTPPKK